MKRQYMIQHYLKNKQVQWQELEEKKNRKKKDFVRVQYTGTVVQVDPSNTLALVQCNETQQEIVVEVCELNRV